MTRSAAGAIVGALLTGAIAAQGPPAPKPLVPAAANSIVEAPDAFVGQLVTVTAAVEQVVSDTSFTVGQRPGAGTEGELLVIAPVLIAPVSPDVYVTLIGEVVLHEGRPAIRATSVLTAAGVDLAKRPPPPRPNPTIDLLAARKPVFGLYMPSAGRGGGAEAAKTSSDLAKEALSYPRADLLFSGAMEGNFERGYGPFAALVREMATSPARLRHPLATKIPKIGADVRTAADNISRQLNLGVSTIVFVEAESAAEVQQGLAAMRFKANGGTRPEAVGSAPAYWGVSEQVYRAKADLWPLNPEGELVNWTIVETKEGLANVREIAAVKGLGALFPGAGSLRRVFTTVDQDGQRVFDEAAWEGAIQQVLAACKEFDVRCGYPATEKDIELRMKQGFSVFIINWGDAGFRAVDIGRNIGGR